VPEAFVSLTPANLDPIQVYDLIVAVIQPRPIALISTISVDGVANLAPFSFFMVGGSNPPSVLYSSMLKDYGEKKGSLCNVEMTGEFVVNTLTREMAEGMSATSYDFPQTYDDWSLSGFTPLESEMVRPQRVAESPVQLECKLFQIVEHGHAAGSACYVIGEVVRIHIFANLWDGYSLHPDKFRPIGRMGGKMYLDTNSLELFTLESPTQPLDPSLET